MRFSVAWKCSRELIVRWERTKHKIRYSTLFATVTMLAKLEVTFPKFGPLELLVSCITINGAIFDVSEVLENEDVDVPSASAVDCRGSLDSLVIMDDSLVVWIIRSFSNEQTTLDVGQRGCMLHQVMHSCMLVWATQGVHPLLDELFESSNNVSHEYWLTCTRL